jgi:hypothetical protein
MALTLFLLAAAVVIGVAAARVAQSSGPDVAKRFLEVTPDYTAEGLRHWISNSGTQLHRYVYPVLFPLDILFLMALAGFFAVASIATAQALQWGRNSLWIFAIFPVLYAACDFIENVMLARLLLSPTAVTDHAVTRAQTVTHLKFATVAISALQLVLLLIWGGLRLLGNALG